MDVNTRSRCTDGRRWSGCRGHTSGSTRPASRRGRGGTREFANSRRQDCRSVDLRKSGLSGRVIELLLLFRWAQRSGCLQGARNCAETRCGRSFGTGRHWRSRCSRTTHDGWWSRALCSVLENIRDKYIDRNIPFDSPVELPRHAVSPPTTEGRAHCGQGIDVHYPPPKLGPP